MNVVYDTINGKVKYWCNNLREELTLEAEEDFYENCPSAVTHIINGELVVEVPVPPTEAEYKELEIEKIRAARNHYLSLSDWTQAVDAPIPKWKKTVWSTYREVLRNITVDCDPTVFMWPNPPSNSNMPETPKEIELALTESLESYYDSIARIKRYDDRKTCALRAGYAGPFQAEGAAFAIWMDTCNVYGYQVMADVQAELRVVPTAEELIAELPEPPWSNL